MPQTWNYRPLLKSAMAAGIATMLATGAVVAQTPNGQETDEFGYDYDFDREPNLPPVAEIEESDNEPYYIDPAPLRPRLIAGQLSPLVESVRGNDPETLRTHRRMGTFR